ncbi:MAG: type II toxin-antitoxin system HicA family toxin [Bacteroidales bacterium]|nr:type II toxin-antitoxin system HicA family toxin [Bacteroidales bacterium]MBR3500351.1 type II toxin-antitoxin system HicA family toxin [Bacteroidales bacterium]
MKYSELRRLLYRQGCIVIRQGSNHEIWYSPITGRRFPVGRHDAEEVYIGTLKDIIKQSGIQL